MVRSKPIATLKTKTISTKLICGTNTETRFEKSYPNDDIGMNQNFYFLINQVRLFDLVVVQLNSLSKHFFYQHVFVKIVKKKNLKCDILLDSKSYFFCETTLFPS